MLGNHSVERYLLPEQVVSSHESLLLGRHTRQLTESVLHLLLGCCLTLEFPSHVVTSLVNVVLDRFPDLLVLLEAEEVVFMDADELCFGANALHCPSIRFFPLNHVLKADHAVLAQQF